MSKRVLQIVLLISCCHLLVHVYEQSFSSVEQLVGDQYGVTQAITGQLGTTFRLPFGVCALFAGWLADRWGARRMLLVYLLGCAVAACLVAVSPSLAVLFLTLFVMGTFASIYHPAGLALIGRHTTAENRPMALGYHGILGSIGIATGPFIAAGVLQFEFTWQQYYFFLAVPGVLLAVLIGLTLPRDEAPTEVEEALAAAAKPQANGASAVPQTPAGSNWGCYFLLISAILLSGFVYASVMTFLARYLDDIGLRFGDLAPESQRNLLAGGVLLLGAIGQYTAGRVARPHTLERWLMLVFFLTAPCLLAMGVAQGPWRIAAAAVFAPVFFMHQPLYNSLVAKYIRRDRRSLAYGLSFTLGFGGGSLGPAITGALATWSERYGDVISYSVLAGLILVSSLMIWILSRLGSRDGVGH